VWWIAVSGYHGRIGERVQVSRRGCWGYGQGMLAFVEIGQNKIHDVLRHDEIEGGLRMGFDSTEAGMISAGGKDCQGRTEKG